MKLCPKTCKYLKYKNPYELMYCKKYKHQLDDKVVSIDYGYAFRPIRLKQCKVKTGRNKNG
jgi:hypothetical protein